jgi:anti-sigma B factor antagonist
VKLSGEATIHRAAEIKQVCLALLEGKGSAELDLSGVTEIDSAGLQILLLLAREARRLERPLRLIGHSPAVLEVLALLHLDRDLAAPFT